MRSDDKILLVMGYEKMMGEDVVLVAVGSWPGFFVWRLQERERIIMFH